MIIDWSEGLTRNRPILVPSENKLKPRYFPGCYLVFFTIHTKILKIHVGQSIMELHVSQLQPVISNLGPDHLGGTTLRSQLPVGLWYRIFRTKMVAAVAVFSPKSSLLQNPISFRGPNSSFLGGSLKGLFLQLKPRNRSRDFINLVVASASSSSSSSTNSSGGGRFYLNFTGFPFPLGPFLNRRTIRTEVVFFIFVFASDFPPYFYFSNFKNLSCCHLLSVPWKKGKIIIQGFYFLDYDFAYAFAEFSIPLSDEKL